jgi:hypothetical protein
MPFELTHRRINPITGVHYESSSRIRLEVPRKLLGPADEPSFRLIGWFREILRQYSGLYHFDLPTYRPLTADIKIVETGELVELKRGHCRLKPNGIDGFIIAHQQFALFAWAEVPRLVPIFSKDSGQWTWLLTVLEEFPARNRNGNIFPLPKKFLLIHRKHIPCEWYTYPVSGATAECEVVWSVTKEELQDYLICVDHCNPKAMVEDMGALMSRARSSRSAVQEVLPTKAEIEAMAWDGYEKAGEEERISLTLVEADEDEDEEGEEEDEEGEEEEEDEDEEWEEEEDGDEGAGGDNADGTGNAQIQDRTEWTRRYIQHQEDACASLLEDCAERYVSNWLSHLTSNSRLTGAVGFSGTCRRGLIALFDNSSISTTNGPRTITVIINVTG